MTGPLGGGMAPMLLMLAGMGVNQMMATLPKVINSVMDLQQMGQGDAQENPGALPTPAEGAPPPDQGGMPGPTGAPPPPPMAPPGAPMGGAPSGPPPPGLAQMLMLMAMRNRMAGGPPST